MQKIRRKIIWTMLLLTVVLLSIGAWLYVFNKAQVLAFGLQVPVKFIQKPVRDFSYNTLMGMKAEVYPGAPHLAELLFHKDKEVRSRASEILDENFFGLRPQAHDPTFASWKKSFFKAYPWFLRDLGQGELMYLDHALERFLFMEKDYGWDFATETFLHLQTHDPYGLVCQMILIRDFCHRKKKLPPILEAWQTSARKDQQLFVLKVLAHNDTLSRLGAIDAYLLRALNSQDAYLKTAATRGLIRALLLEKKDTAFRVKRPELEEKWQWAKAHLPEDVFEEMVSKKRLTYDPPGPVFAYVLALEAKLRAQAPQGFFGQTLAAPGRGTCDGPHLSEGWGNNTCVHCLGGHNLEGHLCHACELKLKSCTDCLRKLSPSALQFMQQRAKEKASP